MKQIKIIESNNHSINLNSNLNIKDIHSIEMAGLRDFYSSKVQLDTTQEPDIFFETMNWVHSQWKHNGLNSAPEGMTSLEILRRAHDGENFRCVEYAKVTADVLNSLGYVTRSVNIISKDADYGGVGMAHMATEVWSNALDKWIYLDPQFNTYAVHNQTPLSYYEIYQHFDEVEFILLNEEVSEEERTKTIERYKTFVSNYFGYMCIFQYKDGVKTRLTLHLDNPSQQLAFQNMALDNAIYSKNMADLYYSLNRTMILFEYKEKVDINQVLKENRITNAEEYERNLHLFAAKPHFHLRFYQNMEWFSHFEVQIDGNEVLQTKENYLDLELKEGMNTIEICSVNELGIKGVKTRMKIRYL